MIAIEVTAVVDALGTKRVAYFADERFATRPTDTPANVAFSEAVFDPGWISITMFGDARTSGATKLLPGEVILANGDGRWDGWLAYGFDGQPIVIRQGPADGAYPADFTALLAGAVKSVRVDTDQVVISIRERSLIFDKPVLASLYAGDNVLPNGFEGVEADLKGKPKPRVLGGPVREIAPVCVNTSKLIYQLHDGTLASVGGVWDSGAALTFGTDRASKALMAANAPAGGSYDTCLAEGLVRLGATPTGQLSADATAGAAPADRTAAALIRALIVEAGVDPADIAEADFAALGAANAAPLALWLTDAATTYTQALDAIANSIGAWWGFDPDGLFRVGRLEAPSGVQANAAFEIPAYAVLGTPQRRPAKDDDVPVWRTAVRYGQLYTPQTSGLAGGVDAARRAYLASEWRSAFAEDPAVLTVHQLALDDTWDSLLTSAADAQAEAERDQALHGVGRDFFDLTVPSDLLTANGVRIGLECWWAYDRFGLEDGGSLIVTGVRPSLNDSTALLTLWR